MADYKDMCEVDRMLPIHQLNKINEKGTERFDFFPLSVVQAIFDKTGIRLDTIISSFNYIFLPYKGTKEDTRLQVVGLMRRKSLVICYRDLDDNTIIEMYNSNDRGDNAWKDDNNWIDFADYIFDCVLKILGNLDDYPDIFEQIKQIIYNTIKPIVDNWLETNAVEIINNKLTELANNYFNSDEFITLLKQLIDESVNSNLEINLQPAVDKALEEVQRYIINNERVVANALSRHEEDLLNLKS